MSLFQGNKEILKVVVLQSKLRCASFCAPFAGLLILIDEQRHPQGDTTSLGTLLAFRCLMVVFLRNFVVGVQFDVWTVHQVLLRLRKTLFSAEISFSKCVLNVYKWLATCDLHLRFTGWTRVKYKSDFRKNFIKLDTYHILHDDV